LYGGDPALPENRLPEFFQQPGHGIDVSGRHEVLQRFLGQVPAQGPVGGAAAQHRDRAGLEPLKLGQQRIPEQVVVAVPLPAPVQRH
jgi:hypothetical protein